MLQLISDESLITAGVRLFLWRLDRLPHHVSGNKYYKLLPNLTRARGEGFARVASFGGPWSNHLHALAAGGAQAGVSTLGVVRDTGEGASAMLEDCRAQGMELVFVSRSDYRRREDPGYLQELRSQWPDTFWVPEGGSNTTGVQGCARLGRDIATVLSLPEFSVALACGTGGTLAGLAAGLQASAPAATVWGYPVLKGDFMVSAVERHLRAANLSAANWQIQAGFHGGGYAKCSAELADFIRQFYRRHRVALEPVYTGKLLYALYQQAAADELRGRTVVALHTGGLQGLRGYPALLADMTEMGFQGL